MRREIVLLMVLSLCPSLGYALTGQGTELEPYLIQSLTDFDEFASDPNYWDDHIQLECDINLVDRTYTEAVIAPDISTDSGFQGSVFMGVFNGDGHMISNLTIDTLSDEDASNDNNCFLGLFGGIENGEIISSLSDFSRIHLSDFSPMFSSHLIVLDRMEKFHSACCLS